MLLKSTNEVNLGEKNAACAGFNSADFLTYGHLKSGFVGVKIALNHY